MVVVEDRLNNQLYYLAYPYLLFKFYLQLHIEMTESNLGNCF